MTTPPSDSDATRYVSTVLTLYFRAARDSHACQRPRSQVCPRVL